MSTLAQGVAGTAQARGPQCPPASLAVHRSFRQQGKGSSAICTTWAPVRPCAGRAHVRDALVPFTRGSASIPRAHVPSSWAH